MSADLKLLVVGSSGFIGRAVVDLMVARDVPGVALSRHGACAQRGMVRHARVESYEDQRAIAAQAVGCGAAILLAGRAHVMKEDAPDSEAAFMSGNRDILLAVAEAFASAGGRRLVLVSSVAVHGTAIERQPFRETDLPAPENAYGRSKLSGEETLRQRCAALGLELVVVRPPLVYGPGAPGHFGQLLRAAKSGLPLPLGAVRNRRSVIGVENLADLLLLAARHPGAAEQTFLVSDGADTSTAEIARALYTAAGHQGRLLSVPPALVRAAAVVLGRSGAASRLLGDLTVDSSRVRSTLGWEAPLTTAEGLERSVKDVSQ